MNDQSNFVREERFIVVKRKHLSADTEDRLRAFLEGESVPTVECVVVEADWPEYEPVWDMIAARTLGLPAAQEVAPEANNLTDLISRAVTARMTPEFIEKEVTSRVDKLIAEAVNTALRSYSDTGKLIEAAIAEALKVDRLDLPSYGHVVTGILKAQIEATVAPLVAGRLSADMEELLSLAPKEVKLSSIAEDMLKKHEGEAYGPVITVIVERTDSGSAWVYLDEDVVHNDRAKSCAAIRLLVTKEGTVASATINGRNTKKIDHIGRAYGLEQKVRAWVACGTVITLDEDNVVTSVGDY
jgi:hypothetical protein